LTPPRHGWLELRFEAGLEAHQILVSHVPFDSLAELARAVLGFLETGRVQTARFCSEPDIVKLEVGPGPSEGMMRLVVSERFVHEGDSRQLARAVWRGFRRLEGQFDPSHWAHAFPVREVEALDVRSRPRSSG
jgi:hypothetical protein